MLEDYVVTIRLPVDEVPGAPGAVLGAGFGLNVDDSAEAVWYSDGQDVWLPESQATVYAMFRGQLRFVPKGSLSLDPPSTTMPPPSPDEPPSPLLPAIGDCLVLDLWPQDFLKLREILPDPLLVPKRIVYQNVDRDSAVDAAVEIISTHVDHYKKLFLNEGEDEARIGIDVILSRARTWLTSKWIEGSVVGVYVDPTENAVAISEAASVPTTAPADLPPYARLDHGTPDAPAGFRRLTLKVLDEDGRMLHPAFLFYLLAGTEDEALAVKWSPDSAFIRAEIDAVAELPAVRVASRLEEDESEPLDPDAPPALPMLRLQIKHSSVPIWINGLYDPFVEPDEGRWRFQSKLPPGEYEDTYDGPPLYAAQATPRRITLPEEPARRIFRDVGHQQWLPFHDPDVPGGGRRRRFILGINMETCRQNHYHDLSATDLLYDYYSGGSTAHGGRLETTYGPTSSGAARTPWLSSSTNIDLLCQDLEAIRSMGATAVRVWVFEYLEGIRFECTQPAASELAIGGGSALMRARLAADNRSHENLRSFVLPSGETQRMVTMHACTLDEFGRIAGSWADEGHPIAVAPSSNPLFAELLHNAAQLQAMAGARGLRVLWTLMTHYGETKPEVGGHQLIHSLQNRDGDLPMRRDPSGNVPTDEWVAYYRRPPNPGPGRLPIEAWIYRHLITDPDCRGSFIRNALIPFVRHMETVASGEPLGYEVCNEIDVVWDLSTPWWAKQLSGHPVETYFVWRMVNNGGRLAYVNGDAGRLDDGDREFPTRWKMTTNQLRTFVAKCAEEIRRIVPRDRIVLSGVLGTQDDESVLGQELALVSPGPATPARGSPHLELSASAFTKYAWASSWRLHYDNVWQAVIGDTGYGLRAVSDLAAETSPASHLLHNNRCLIVEAGESLEQAVNARSQAQAVRDLLTLARDQGYAGVFVWHYHNPARSPNFESWYLNLPLTENGAITHEPTSFQLVGNIWGRLAVREIQRFSRSLGRLQLPPATFR